jgi:hypothetical protein
MADPKCKEPEIIPWPDRIRRTGEPEGFPRSSFTGSVWATDLDKAITAINQLLKNKVGLAFKKADEEAGSEIVAETVSGSSLHGKSELATMGLGDRERLGSVRLRVPATPQISGVDAGHPVRLHIMVHELVHCIGLTNCAHSKDDVFIARPVISVGRTVGGKALPLDGSGSIPAPKFGANTIMKIKKAWDIP